MPHYHICYYFVFTRGAPIAQWLERSLSKREAGGSNPPRGSRPFSFNFPFINLV